MINNEYIDEIIYTSKLEKYLSKELITKIIIDVIDKCDPLTQSNFKKIEFDSSVPKIPNTLATCNPKTGVVTCYYDTLLEDINNEKLRKLSSNLRIIGTILHEIEHLKEEYKISLNNFESKLIQNGSGYLIFDLLKDKYLKRVFNKYKNSQVVEYILLKKYDLVYDKIWEICPDEKIAEAAANKELLKSLDNYYNFEEKYAFTYHKVKKWYIASLMMGYNYDKKLNSYNIPLNEYLSEIARLDVNGITDSTLKEECFNINQYEIEDRMKYGLYITRKDFIEVKQKYLKNAKKHI